MAPITTEVVCFSRLLKYFRESETVRTQIWVQTVCPHNYIKDQIVLAKYAIDDFSRWHFRLMFKGTLRAKWIEIAMYFLI